LLIGLAEHVGAVEGDDKGAEEEGELQRMGFVVDGGLAEKNTVDEAFSANTSGDDGHDGTRYLCTVRHYTGKLDTDVRTARIVTNDEARRCDTVHRRIEGREW
jgi:hypothetical protein